jgi:hypothetical protein
MRISTNRFKIVIYFIFLISQILFYSNVYGQESKPFTSKGVVEFGGSFSYQLETYTYQVSQTGKSTVISFLPIVGYFIIDNLEVGVNPFEIVSSGNEDYRNTNYLLLLSISYNIKSGESLFPFIEAQGGYAAQSYSYSSHASLDIPNSDGYVVGGRAGIKYALFEHGLLNIGMQYQRISLTTKGYENRVNTILATFAIGFTFWL